MYISWHILNLKLFNKDNITILIWQHWTRDHLTKQTFTSFTNTVYHLFLASQLYITCLKRKLYAFIHLINMVRNNLLKTITQPKQLLKQNTVHYGIMGYSICHYSSPWCHIYASVNQVTLVQTMACHLFSGKPLSKPMLGYCQLDP